MSPYSFEGNDELPLWRGLTLKKKPPFFNACARVNLCAIEMRNAILTILIPRISRAQFFLAVFVRVKANGQSERETTRSLSTQSTM